ncbi:uncharacterized protein LOC129800573 [Phlebotomus papatasi]|uniref:uncharacterized protein LOC129800573 n=1 Tax=Phlebotomus papatasi TaxID=29031 RepID=UPI002483D4EE|nr:uncharacterized protein LOC129800573 [Phlebotomus papatasi]
MSAASILVLLLPQLCAGISVSVSGGPSSSSRSPGGGQRAPPPNYTDTRSYSYAATDFSTANGTHIKTITVIKNLEAVPETELPRPIHEDSPDIKWPKNRQQDFKSGGQLPEYVPFNLAPRAVSVSSRTPQRRTILSATSSDIFKVNNLQNPKISQEFIQFPSSTASVKLFFNESPQPFLLKVKSPSETTKKPSSRGKQKVFLEDFSIPSRSTEKPLPSRAKEVVEVTISSTYSPESTETEAASVSPETTSESGYTAPRVREFVVGGMRRL